MERKLPETDENSEGNDSRSRRSRREKSEKVPKCENPSRNPFSLHTISPKTTTIL